MQYPAYNHLNCFCSCFLTLSYVLNSNFDDCGLTDEDFDDLGACFDLIDRSSIAVM